MHSSAASKPLHPRTGGYVLVPVNASTRSFLSQFSNSLPPLDQLPTSDIPPAVPLSTKKRNKKRTPTDDLSLSFGHPVNKKRGGSLDDPEPRTKLLAKSPYSAVAGCCIRAEPRKKATPSESVQGLGSMQPKTNKSKSRSSVDGSYKVAVPRRILPTIDRVPGVCVRRNASCLKGPTMPNSNMMHLLKSPFSIDEDTEKEDDNNVKCCLGAEEQRDDDDDGDDPEMVLEEENYEDIGFRTEDSYDVVVDDLNIEAFGFRMDNSYDDGDNLDTIRLHCSVDDGEGFEDADDNLFSKDKDNDNDAEEKNDNDNDDDDDDDDDDRDEDPDYEDEDGEDDNGSVLHCRRSTVEARRSLRTVVTISNASTAGSSASQSSASSSNTSFSNADDHFKSSSRSPTENHNNFSHVYLLPIIASFPRPSIVTDTLPNYNYNASCAPSPERDSIVTYETMDTSADLSLNLTEPFASAGIASLQSYVKRGRGIVWQNRSSSKLHYETDLEYFKQHTKPKARLLQIPHHIFYPDGGEVRHVVSGKDNAFVIVSGGTFDNFHDKVCFQELIRDACIPGKNTIPHQDKLRRNSGPSVGLSSSQGTTRSSKQAYATPNFVTGTARYSKIFGIVSETTRALLRSCGLSTFIPQMGISANQKQLSYHRRCEELCNGNLYLGLSFKIYVHHPADIHNHKGHFHAHRDVNNPDYRSPNDIFFTAWDTWFEPLLNLYVTGTIILCGRRSQEELYDRIFKIGRATEEIIARSQSLPLSQRSIHQDMLCPRGVEYTTSRSHLMQIHALTPNEYLYKLSRLIGGKQGLSAYLATEIILGYHQTSNNALRFHRFMSMLLSSVKQHNDLRFLGRLTFIESYQRYCYETYGGFEGTTDRNGVREGIVRHQPSLSSPISHYANWRSLQNLVTLLQSYGRTSSCNQRRYEQLVKELKTLIVGLGDLKSQKAVMTFASLELFINRHYMSYFSTGSLQQLKNLKREPFGFNRADEVSQLRRNLLVRMPQLLPMQADEYICALTSRMTTSTNKNRYSEEPTGEVYYAKQSIFNAGLMEDGTITLHRFNWTRKQNEPAPDILFNDSLLDNHYVPKWATSMDLDIPRGAFVSLCSTKNMKNVPKQKTTINNVLDFIVTRDITPDDFQKLLSVGFYHVVPDLMNEVTEYLDCKVNDLTKAIRTKRASQGGYSCDINMNKIHNSSSTQNILYGGNLFLTLHQSMIAILIKILTDVTVEDKAPWTNKFFGNKKPTGFLLLLPRSKCGSFCVVAAFIYLNQNGSVMCCMLDESGKVTTTW